MSIRKKNIFALATTGTEVNGHDNNLSLFFYHYSKKSVVHAAISHFICLSCCCGILIDAQI